MKTKKVAIVGASGYSGEVLVQLLLNHPHAELVAVTSRRNAGQTLAQVFPKFASHPKTKTLRFTEPNAEVLAKQADVVFLALPHGVAAATGPDAVTDAAGKPLDGDWTNGTSSYPSGNGVVGGDFNFALNVLPGDTNKDGIVNGLDIALIASHWLQTSGIIGDTNGDNTVNGLDIAQVASHWLTTLPAGGAGASAASIADTSSPLGSASVSSTAVSTKIGTSGTSTLASSAGLLGLPAPDFSAAPAVESIAAFVGRPDVTKSVAMIDHVLSEGTGGQSHALGPWARPGITSLAKSQAATGAHSTGSAGVEAEVVGEQLTSPLDDELLSVIADRP